MDSYSTWFGLGVVVSSLGSDTVQDITKIKQMFGYQNKPVRTNTHQTQVLVQNTVEMQN